MAEEAEEQITGELTTRFGRQGRSREEMAEERMTGERVAAVWATEDAEDRGAGNNPSIARHGAGSASLRVLISDSKLRPRRPSGRPEQGERGSSCPGPMSARSLARSCSAGAADTAARGRRRADSEPPLYVSHRQASEPL